MKKILVTISILVTFTNCTKEIPLKEKDKEQKLVIHAFISSNDSTKIYAGNAISIMDENVNKINENIALKLKQGSSLLANFTHSFGGYYKPDRPLLLQPGINYNLEASSPGFETVYASQTIPSPVDFSVSANQIKNGEGYNQILIDITFNDAPNRKNYYAIEIFGIDSTDLDHTGTYHKIFGDGYTSDQSVIETYESDILTGQKYPTDGYFLLTDDLFDGKSHSTKIHYTFYIPQENNSKSGFFVAFHSWSEDNFQYFYTKAKYNYSNEDPFSQPVQIYGNINNGLGIFGGRSKTVKSFKVDP